MPQCDVRHYDLVNIVLCVKKGRMIHTKDAIPKIRSRLYSCILYPEDESHQHAIETLSGGNYPAVGCLHDKDIQVDTDTGEALLDDDGNVLMKKPHYHFVIRFKNARNAHAVAEELQIADNYLQKSSDFSCATRYLIHMGELDKFQYSIGNLIGALREQAIEAMDDVPQGQRALEILEIIDSQIGVISCTQLIRICATEGRWSDLRRGGQWFMQALREHNDKYSSKPGGERK